MHREPYSKVLILLSIAGVYFLAGKLGLQLAYVNASSAVGPAAGIAVAALLIWGTRAWPAIFAGAFLVNITSTGSILTSLGISVGNTVEAVTAACLIAKYAGGRQVFERSYHIFKFALFTAIGATIS